MTITLHFTKDAVVTLRATAAKDGSTFLAARPASETKVTRFGFNVPLSVVGGKLPSGTVEVREDGKAIGSIVLTPSVTETGNPKVVGGNAIDITVEGVSQKLKIERISQPNASTANVLIRSARPTSRSFDTL